MTVSLPLDANQIQEIIPHRFPFLLIDSVLEMEEGKRVVAIKNVTINEPFFPGHFPGYAVMPGVLILEAMAQACSVLLLSEPTNHGKLGLFGGVDNCRFRRQVRPGDTLRLEVEVTALRSTAGKGHGRALVGDALACEADFTFALAPTPTST